MEPASRPPNESIRKFRDQNPDFKKNLGTHQGLRNLEYEWWQVAEFNYDNFNGPHRREEAKTDRYLNFQRREVDLDLDLGRIDFACQKTCSA